jgi:nucleoside-diphosphate-sugar epimerase
MTHPTSGSTGTIAVTGAMGFVASRLFPRLRELGRPLVAVVRPGRDALTLESQGIEVRSADLELPESHAAAFDGVDAVVHLSGMAQATRLVPVLVSRGVRRGVFISSAGVYTKLESASADKKRSGEAVLRASSLAYTILRPSMIYGTPADRNMARLLAWIQRFPVVVVPGSGDTLQQPVHVDDLVSAMIAALGQTHAGGREYDVGGPEALPLREVIRICGAALGRRPLIVPTPLRPTHGLVTLIRRLGLRAPVRPEQVLRLAESKAVDIGPAMRDLGFAPRSFEAGIRAEAEEMKAR